MSEYKEVKRLAVLSIRKAIRADKSQNKNGSDFPTYVTTRSL
jgi:hypothetical protein